MPLLSKLAAAADIRDSQYAAIFLDERQHRNAEERSDRDAESAITCMIVDCLKKCHNWTKATRAPYCNAGAVPSRGVSRCLTINIGTRVPSRLSYHTCSDSKSAAFIPFTSVSRYTFQRFPTSVCAKSYRATVPGVVNPTSVAKNHVWSRLAESVIVPTKSLATCSRCSPARE